MTLQRYCSPRLQEIPIVDIIASGYEWICPKGECANYNTEIEVRPYYYCGACGLKVEVGDHLHAYK